MPYSKGFSRSIRKEFKIYFFDCASSYEESQKLENAVASSLLKLCNWKQDTTGQNWGLYFFRDKEKREVDFILTRGKLIVSAIEVKTGEDSLSPHLKYFHERTDNIISLQLVKNIEKNKEINGIKISELSKGILKFVKEI